jgi:hypothetical protein
MHGDKLHSFGNKNQSSFSPSSKDCPSSKDYSLKEFK